MKPLTLAGLTLIVLGLLGLGYGSFSWTQATHQASIGPVALSVKETRSVNVPAWAGGAGIALGLVLLVLSGRKA